jgi:hypothetical protein
MSFVQTPQFFKEETIAGERDFLVNSSNSFIDFNSYWLKGRKKQRVFPSNSIGKRWF